MATLVYRCPTTGYLVQGWFADNGFQDGADVYEPITCFACGRLHNVDPKTGKVLGSGPIRIFKFTDPGRL